MEDQRDLIKVVAGVVLNKEGDYLLSSRPKGKPYAGYWEFAGGKVERGETELEALKREFKEELGINIHYATPWLTKVHSYEHAHIHLRFFRVNVHDWSGTLEARENQSWSWQKAGHFDVSPMLPANQAVLSALSIPTKLEGNLNIGFYGQCGKNDYRVIPYSLSMPVAQQPVMVSVDELNILGNYTDTLNIWVIIHDKKQLDKIKNINTIVWEVNNALVAEDICMVLKQGMPVPIIIYTNKCLIDHYGYQWRALGAHSIIQS